MAPRVAANDHPALLDTNKGQLYHIWFSSDAKKVERHHFLCLPFAARKSYAFSTFFNFSILNPMASSQPMFLITMTSYHLSPLNITDLIHRGMYTQAISLSLSPHRCRPILEEKRSLACLAPCSTALELANATICDGLDGLREMDDLIGQYICI